jgi:hypothetical protein
MRRSRPSIVVTLLVAASAGAALANGCSAAGTGGQTATGTGGSGGTSVTTTSGTGGETVIIPPDASFDANEDVVTNPCGSKCGPVELCDPDHLGTDDNCDGLVDEGCGCNPGEAHFCFKGDQSFRGAPGCFDGTELCNEQGHFGDCIGGVHAAPPDNCYMTDPNQCHAISAAPFASVHLKDGTGTFSTGALAGTETYTVQCPAGVSQCPVVTSPDTFKPLQSGEYTVTYTKQIAGDPNPRSCTFPLEVGAPGLRVELSWEHNTQDSGVDLDLHLHKPMSTKPWGIQPGVPDDCTWSNCIIDNFANHDATAPSWFADWPAMPPTPVNWFNDALHPANNTCYFDPRGVGKQWSDYGKGCHNPRLDIDNRQCDFKVTDPNNDMFCTPENINVDFPPTGQWMRMGVHYYWNHALTYDVHPRVKVFCNGGLAADLGPQGYYSPEAPVTFEASDGASTGANRFWIVADVAFVANSCNQSCVVKPIYSDPTNRTPFFTLDTAAKTQFAPPYPPFP